jgi:hypothetical protein
MLAFHRTTILAAVLALLIGPQWCCCSMRAFAGPRPAATTTACCPCCAGATADTGCAEADRATERDGDQDGHRCPCRGKHRSVAATAVQIEQRIVVPSGPVLTGIASAWPLPETLATGQVDVFARPTPMAGRSLLSLLGVLRC